MNSPSHSSDWRQTAEPDGVCNFAFAIGACDGQVGDAARLVPNPCGPRLTIPTPSLSLRPDLWVRSQLSFPGWIKNRANRRGFADRDTQPRYVLAFHDFAINSRATITAHGGSIVCARPLSSSSSQALRLQVACKPTASVRWQGPQAALSLPMRPTITSSRAQHLVRLLAPIATTRACARAATKTSLGGPSGAQDFVKAVIGANRPGGGFSYFSSQDHDRRGRARKAWALEGKDRTCSRKS